MVAVEDTATRPAETAAAVREISMDPCTRRGVGVSLGATFESTATGRCAHLGKARRCTTLPPCCYQHTVAADPPRWWPGNHRAAQGSTPPPGCERGASTAGPHPSPAHMCSHSSSRAARATNSGRRAAASDSAASPTQCLPASAAPARPNGRGAKNGRNLHVLLLTYSYSRQDLPRQHIEAVACAAQVAAEVAEHHYLGRRLHLRPVSRSSKRPVNKTPHACVGRGGAASR